MSQKPDSVINKAASVQDRLKILAKAEKTDFQRLLNNYAIQKLLVRIDKSPYKVRIGAHREHRMALILNTKWR